MWNTNDSNSKVEFKVRSTTSKIWQPRHDHEIGLALATGGLLLLSLDSLGIRLTGLDSWQTAFWLGTFTALSMFIWLPMHTGQSLPSVARVQGFPLLLSALFQTASTAFFILAINLTAVANTMVIFATTPIVAAIISMLAIREKTSTRTWLGIAGSFIGILIVVSGSFARGSVAGDLFAMAAIVSYAANLTLWRRFPELNRAAVIGLSGVGLALIAFLPADLNALDLRALLILALLGLVTGPTGKVLIATSTRYLPVSQVSLLTPVETVAATTWAWLFLNETPPTTALVGGVLIIGSLIFGVSKQSRF